MFYVNGKDFVLLLYDTYDKIELKYKWRKIMAGTHYEELSWLKSDEEKSAYLNQESAVYDFEGQTNGQRLYTCVAKMIDKLHTIKNGENFKDFMTKHQELIMDNLKEIVGNEYFPTYMKDLETRRDARTKQIMAETKHLYHFSQTPPEKFRKELIPHEQERGNALGEKVGEFLCYASNTDESPYIVKPSSSDPEEYKDVGVHMDANLVLVTGLDPEGFIKEQALSYCYEVKKDTFTPNVGLDGNFTNEYESAQPAEVISVKGPFSIVDMCKPRGEGGWEIPVYFCPNKDDRPMIMAEIKELMTSNNISKRDAFLKISTEKLFYFNEDNHLMEIARKHDKDLREKYKAEKLMDILHNLEHSKENKNLTDTQQKIENTNQETEKASETLRQKYEMDKLANTILIKRGLQNPKNQKAVSKIADKKLRETGKPLTDKDMKVIKVKIANKGR